MNLDYLDFEQPLAETQQKISELRRVGTDSDININAEVEKLENKSAALTESIYKSLTAHQIVQVARHPMRPYTMDYISGMFTDFDELYGDRRCSSGPVIVGGLALLDSMPVMVIGHQKGRTTNERLARNFGMATPEDFRKSLRLMQLAEKFNLPVITLIDTPGAYPCIAAEERNQSEAIAKNLMEMIKLKVPIVCCVIGEGCSGGALAIGVGDRVSMLQYSYYAVISPEGCASILWKNASKSAIAAQAMQLQANELLDLGLIDAVVPEPLPRIARRVELTGNQWDRRRSQGRFERDHGRRSFEWRELSRIEIVTMPPDRADSLSI